MCIDRKRKNPPQTWVITKEQNYETPKRDIFEFKEVNKMEGLIRHSKLGFP